MTKSLAWVFLGTLLLGNGSLRAEDAFLLDEQKISAAPIDGNYWFGQSAHDYPGKLLVFEAKDLLGSSSENWSQALGYKAGFMPVLLNGVLSQAVVRGLPRQQTLVLNDGIVDMAVRMNPRHPSPILADLDHVDVIKGLASLEMGFVGSAGAINLFHKRPPKSEELELSVKTGSYGKQLVSLGYGRPLDEGSLHRWRMDATLDQSQGYRGAGWDRTALSTAYSAQIGSLFTEWRVSALAGRFATDSGIPVDSATSQLRPETPLSARYNGPNDRLDENAYQLQGKCALKLSDSLVWTAIVSGALGHEYYLSLDRLRLTQTASSLIERTYAYSETDYSALKVQTGLNGSYAVFEGLDLKAAVGWDQFRQSGYGLGFGAPSVKAAPLNLYAPVETEGSYRPAANSETDLEQQSLALDLSLAQKLGGGLTLLAGGRLEQWLTLGQRHRLDPLNRTAIQDLPGVMSKVWLPASRLGAAWEPIEGLVSSVCYAQGAVPVFITDDINGRTDFEPELSDSLEFSERFGSTKAQVAITYFRAKQTHTLLSFGGGVYEQAGELYSEGLELETSVKVLAWLDLKGNYAYTDARYGRSTDAGTDISGKRRPRAPWNQFFIEMGISLPKQLRLTGEVRYLGETYISEDYKVLLPAYHVFGLGLALSGDWLGLDLRVNNVANNQGYLVSGTGGSQVYPGEPRNVVISAKTQF